MLSNRIAQWFLVFPLVLGVQVCFAGPEPVQPSRMQSLDGAWLLAKDPGNSGREQKWFAEPRPEAKAAQVPWIIQDTYPGYHGVAWFWRDFTVPASQPSGGRCLLRFWAVDYLAEVWVNGTAVGRHEGGETPFVLDITEAAKPGTNRLAVRVLNPTPQPIDGIVLAETPHRNKTVPYVAGNAWDQGGIVDSVELLLTPAVRVEDLFVQPDWQSGLVRIQATLRNASKDTAAAIQFAIAPAASGGTVASTNIARALPSGDTVVEAELRVASHRLWELNDPFLYRVSARVRAEGASAFDEQSVRCGFRDFRLSDGYFRLNGRRLFLRCSHTGNASPIGLEMPHDPDLLRRDLFNVKVMGFNAIRFISGVAKRYQLDLCDEIGLLVYEEAYASWCLADSPHMARRYDESILGMVLRDRNHPSVAMWGLLNETPDGAVFRHAVATLPKVRALDPTRLVFLNSGTWQDSGAGALAGLQSWHLPDSPDPNVTHNPLSVPRRASWATWAPGRLCLHPGPKNEFSVVRWTATRAGDCLLAARFFGPENKPTTDVHVLHNGRALFDGLLNLEERGNSVSCSNRLAVAAGDRVDFVVGPGNANYGGDTTALEAMLRFSDGTTLDPARDYQPTPTRSWSYGWLPAAPKPDAAAFRPYTVSETNQQTALGALSNPGSTNWEDVLSDQHPYQGVPHTADIIHKLRTMDGNGRPLFISEYGIGSGLDLLRMARHYERLDKTGAEDARFYRDKLDRFLADWERWRMAEAFGRPEDYFKEVLAKMAGQRLLGLNAIRANPEVVAHSITGTVDQGMTGEGLYTNWRELKPGTLDAVFDGWAPLRWCLFVEPAHCYRGQPARLEAVLANEDQLAPGSYPALLQILGPQNQVVWTCRTNVIIENGPAARVPFQGSLAGDQTRKPEPPFALPVLSRQVVVDGPPGPYRFVASFERGAAPAGGEATFHLGDRATLPAVTNEVLLWGPDAVLGQWLSAQRIPSRLFRAESQSAREVVLVGPRPPAPGAASAFRELAQHVARGSVAIFLCPEVFARDKDPTRWVPLVKKGALTGTSDWLYHKDEWAKPHPVFDGLPAGLLDYTYYRELIPHRVWTGLDAPDEAVAGANNTSYDYSSGLMLSVHRLGAGRVVLNAFPLRERLGQTPAADRLVVNLLRFASRDAASPLAPLPSDFAALLRALRYE